MRVTGVRPNVVAHTIAVWLHRKSWLHPEPFQLGGLLLLHPPGAGRSHNTMMNMPSPTLLGSFFVLSLRTGSWPGNMGYPSQSDLIHVSFRDI